VADDELGPEEAAPDEDGPADAALAVAARHALHDEELVAGLATGSLEDAAEVDRAQALVDRCSACRELYRDLAVIGDALRMDAKGAIAAPRDFRLSVADAQRLGGTVVARGFLAAFRRSMMSFARPMGASMAALGLVGLLVGSAALSAGGAASPTAAGIGPTDTSGPAEIQTGPQQTGGPKSSERTGAFGPESTGDAAGMDQPPADTAAGGANPAVWLLVGSVSLLVAGIALLVISLRRGREGGSPTPDS
jgi:hypothetical protein